MDKLPDIPAIGGAEEDAVPTIAAEARTWLDGFNDTLDMHLPNLWPRVLELVALGARPVLIMGDSHVNLYRRSPRTADGGWVLPLVCLFSACSARGLDNPLSSGGAGQRIARLLAWLATRPAAEHPPILFKFGQVDIEFVSVFKRIAAGEIAFDPASFDTFAAETVDRYARFVSSVAPAGTAVATIFPPTLSDASWSNGYVNAHVVEMEDAGSVDALRESIRHLHVPDIQERTALHRRFNVLLIAAAGAARLASWDDFDVMLGVDGIVDPAYLGPLGGRDHHIDFNAARAPIEALLASRFAHRG